VPGVENSPSLFLSVNQVRQLLQLAVEGLLFGGEFLTAEL
jgi:hypothetical protein